MSDLCLICESPRDEKSDLCRHCNGLSHEKRVTLILHKRQIQLLERIVDGIEKTHVVSKIPEDQITRFMIGDAPAASMRIPPAPTVPPPPEPMLG